MATRKHLVLDDDIHRALMKQKSETGLHLTDIGNCLLRSLLGGPAVADAVAFKLIESGKLTEEEFRRLREEAVIELRGQIPDVGRFVRHAKHDAFTAGSWQIRQVYCAQDGLFQVLSAEARDTRQRPFPAHSHGSDEFFVVLKGALLVTIGERAEIVNAPGCVHVSRLTSHSTTPLTGDTLVVGILSPPEQAYAS